MTDYAAGDVVIHTAHTIHAALDNVSTDVRLWFGELDPTAPPTFGRWYVEHLPSATLEVLEGAGHCFPLPRWAELLTALTA